MLKFLERHHERTGSNDIVALLGSASLLDDGSPADPALSEESHAGVAEVVGTRKDIIAAG